MAGVNRSPRDSSKGMAAKGEGAVSEDNNCRCRFGLANGPQLDKATGERMLSGRRACLVIAMEPKTATANARTTSGATALK